MARRIRSVSKQTAAAFVSPSRIVTPLSAGRARSAGAPGTCRPLEKNGPRSIKSHFVPAGLGLAAALGCFFFFASAAWRMGKAVSNATVAVQSRVRIIGSLIHFQP